MLDRPDFYIDGRWQAPTRSKSIDVINPATEAPCGRISLGGPEDVDLAVGAAVRAFDSWSRTTREERLALLEEIETQFKKRYSDIADAMTEEMGAPKTLAMKAQAGSGLMHLKTTIRLLKSFEFEERNRTTLIVREPVGVCALITPWNWPINQIAVKVFPALAAGCTMVLKPSEIAPFNAMLLADVLNDAGVPPGVFNLVNGD
ncbi:MAG: aldehyde dehydrogenase family protein, partial [Pseudomonadota bacterium]